jgi:hypothetical protein
MKKLFIIGIAFIFALSLAGLTLAREKAKKEEPAGVRGLAIEKSTETAKPVEALGEKAEKEISAKPYIWRMGGLVTAVHLQAKTISIHQETVYHDRVMKLGVSEKVAQELSKIKTGNLVNVWVNGKVVTALNKVT